MKKSISSRVSLLLSSVCLLAAFLVFSAGPGPVSAQNGTPSSAPVKPARTETRTERDEKSEKEKRDELSKKLERRREELNAIPVNNLVPARKTQEPVPAATEAKPKEKK